MIEKDLKAPTSFHTSEGIIKNNISSMDIKVNGEAYKVIKAQLLRSADINNIIRMGPAINHALGQLNFNHNEQILILKELELAGYVELIPFKGWKICSGGV